MQAALAAAALNNVDGKKIAILGGVVIVGGVLLYLGVINPWLKFLQVKDTKAEKKGLRSQTRLSATQTLSPQLYRDNKSLVSISSAKANELATQVYNGKWGGNGGFTDNEGMAVGAITSAGSKVNISYIAHQFSILYGQSMEMYMSYLEPEHWTQAKDYVNDIKNF